MTRYESEEIEGHFDCMGAVVNVGDKVACATTRNVWVGEVLAIPEYHGTYQTTVKIKIKPINRDRSVTLDFVPEKIWLAERKNSRPRVD